jgi:PAS domain S-box-containing protein
VALDERVAELKRYVGFEESDALLLARVHDALASDFPRIAQEFYDKIREHEEAHAVFTGEEQIARLQKSLQAWMHRLLGGTYDAAYYARTERIGEVHVRIGLPQRYMFTAMSLIRLDLQGLVEARAARSEVMATKAALNKAIDMELAVMLEAYSAAHLARIERKQELDRSATELASADVAAMELTSELVVGLDKDGRILVFNSGAEGATGYGREEVIGKPFLETILAEESHAEMSAILAARAVEAKRHRADTFVRTRAGKLRDVRWDIAPTRIGAVAIFLIGHDSTEEKKLGERSRQAEKLAAVGTLAAGLAHEIRNPLNGAQLHVAYLQRMLKRAGATAESLEAVDVVGDEIKRLAVLVTEFLDFARPKPLDKKSTSLFALIERVRGLIAPDAERAKVAVACDLPSKDIEVELDAAKMEQVLLNLARNAIEALAPTGGHVVLRLRRQPRGALVEVEDDGPGLPSPDAPIFDAFFTTKSEGTGLGLAITHRIVTDHGGTIAVESQAGRTIFRVVIPFGADVTEA